MNVKPPSKHEIYMQIAFRPFVGVDGKIGRVGIQNNNPMAFDPEIYPNLISAAPVMYQMLSLIRDGLEEGHPLRAEIETVLTFAIDGLGFVNKVSSIIDAMKRGEDK